METVFYAGTESETDKQYFGSPDDDVMISAAKKEAFVKVERLVELSDQQRSRIYRLACALVDGSLSALEKVVADYSDNPIALAADSRCLARIMPGRQIVVRESIVMRGGAETMLVVEHVFFEKVLIVSTAATVSTLVAGVNVINSDVTQFCFDAQDDSALLLAQMAAILRASDWSLLSALSAPRAVSMSELSLYVHPPVAG